MSIRKRLLALSLLLVSSSASFAEASVALVNERFSDIETLRNMSKNSDSDAVCGEVTAVQSTYVCVFKKTVMMNKSLTRISFFNGTAAGYPKGTLISNSDSTLAEYVQSIGGHAVLGADIQSFYQLALSTSDTRKSLNSQEASFLNDFVRTSRIRSLAAQYAVIAISNQTSDYREVFNHEIYHAKFYLQPKFRAVVESFWANNMSEDDKREVRSILGESYNANDEQIMIDEFQAYLLESDTDSNPLMKFARKYKATLLQLLRNAGA